MTEASHIECTALGVISIDNVESFQQCDQDEYAEG